MFRKFLSGLAFGAGFALAALLVWMVGSGLIFGALVHSGVPVTTASGGPSTPAKPERQFYELSIDEQIRKSSAIALARYETGSDGKVHLVIREFLKKVAGTELYYAIGDEYDDHFSEATRKPGTGVVIFFTGSPADSVMSMTYSGERIRGLGDIPLKLLRQKCQAGA